MGTIQTKKGSTIFGVEHDNIEGAKQVVDDVKNMYPKDTKIVFLYQEKKTGLPHEIVMAGNWANMVGQGEGLDTMNPADYLTDKGRQFLQDAAKEAGFPPIKSFDKPTKRDIHTLYRLAYPQDNGDKKTKVGELSDTFNDARDESLLRKMKKYEDRGYKVVSAAGYSHVDMIKNRI